MQHIATDDLSGRRRCCGGHGRRKILPSCLAQYYFSSLVRVPFFLSSFLLISPFSGNPGLLDFYVPFLDAIYHKANISTSSSVTIFAHAHLGLSSYIGGDRSFPDTSSVSLPAQIQAHVEFLDELLAAYGPETSVLLVGHSIGTWFIQEMLKARAAALRPHLHVGAYMLFPTLSEIGRSPSGKTLSVSYAQLY
jgi:pimeloyl-ACP methyl ester carboxylesterase